MYVLISAIGPVSKDWGLAVVSYDYPDYRGGILSKDLRLGALASYDAALRSYDSDFHSHEDIIYDYMCRTKTDTVNVLGGGCLDILWGGGILNGMNPDDIKTRYGKNHCSVVIRTHGSSGDFGKPKSLLAVKICLDNFLHDNSGWAKDNAIFDIK